MKKQKNKKGEEKKKVIKNLKKVEKTIKINLYPGRRKRKELLRAQRENKKLANELIRLRSKKDSYNSFHKKVYYKFRDWGFHSQVQQATQRRVFAAKKVSNKGFKIIPLEFNFPRSAKISYSNRGNPFLFVSPYKKRIALPIILDGTYKRLLSYLEEGWQKKSWMKKANVTTLEELLDIAIEASVKLIACQMTIDVMKIKKEVLIPECEVGGATTFLEFASEADMTLYI
ncbi:MAG: DsrE/DsrF/DrsH-like family protein [Candidatus Heimdallarchaeaceae archaeon]